MSKIKAKVALPIGLDSVYWSRLLTDEVGGKTTYDNPKYVARALKAVLTPNTKNGLLESDDAVEIDENILTSLTVALDVSQLPDDIRAEMLGHGVDDTGGIIINKDDTPPRGALVFRAMLSDRKNYKYVVLYSGAFKENIENYETDKRDATTYQTESIEGTFYPRESDGTLKYSIRTDNPSASVEKIAAWFTTVQEPSDIPAEATV